MPLGLLLQGKPVELLLDSSIVAYGTVVKFDGTNDNCLKVTIDEVLDEYANLPAPNDESRSINDSVGSHVLWPTHLLNLRDEKKSRNANKEREQSDIDLSGVPAPLRLVYHYCATGNPVRMKLDAEVYGYEQKLFVGLEDTKSFCQLHSIPYTCIGVYIKFLFKKLQQSQKYLFVDPSNIGHIAYKSTDKKFLEEKRQMRCQALAEMLNHASRNQWALVPVNVGEHWVLTVIDPFNDEAAMLDPLFKGNRNVAWKQCVEDSLKIHASSKERRPRKSVDWKIVKVPKQKDGSQCGFYVMTYMKEIIMHRALDTVHSLDDVFKLKDYEKKDINEMRTEWAETVQEFMYA